MAFSPVKSISTFPSVGGVESVSSLKPLQGSGSGIRRIFNVQNNNKKSFVPDLFQEKLQPLQSSFVPSDEPLKYIDSQHSKQEAVQKQLKKSFIQTTRKILKSSNTFTRNQQALANII